ncbi:melanoregulin-like [Anneissia japonica]|uniref:melanoregulin-like n=1 Tax=Anneissia japonica TaxID=1529436 RepID=UPI00142594FD|nr:melanoregulin-like [Anneissia japonica]XP_033114738.1 melanoregulin-like [Anneissia japonica]XP_033114739.1 melanoregulin-like [Anneissia japonica]XP_033114740.1 melanoregulin-like [Anneissia japonica]XP_033114741.1 melanoregulin-like [Anneissia japonica]XP_033114742.1 melanoregulin-like [Anneissia japonica]XP_033114743.1 melanoregulin-like [Anneissia japonica]
MEYCLCCPARYRPTTPPYESTAEERQALISPVRSPYYVDDILTNQPMYDNENLWSEPGDITHMEADDDRRLYNIIQKRDNETPGSQEWMDFDIEISKIRSLRLAIRQRWKKTLDQLGFSDDSQALLVVTSSSEVKTLGSAQRAHQLHDELVTQTSIFLEDVTQPQRYTIILDRLLDLDAAENFVRMAKKMYPKNIERDDIT